MTKGRSAVALLVALVVAGACGDSSDRSDPGAVSGELEAAIVSLTTTAQVPVEGAVEPALVFSPDQDQVGVVAHLGEVAGPLVLTWYRVGGDGDEELFAHTVDVEPADRAFSTGVSPGSLAAGGYRVVAEIDGEGREVLWWVQPEWVASLEDPDSPEAVLAAAEAAAGDPAAGDPPVSGESGVLSGVEETGADAFEAGECHVFVDGLSGAVDPTADIVEFVTNAPFCGDPADPDQERYDLVLSASADGGPTREVGDVALPRDPGAEVAFWLDPCGLDAGSDLPGTNIEITGEVQGGPGEGERARTGITLGPDQTPPVLEIETDPPAGTKVEAGDVITIEVTASELRQPGTTWQTGVKWIVVGGDLQPFVLETFGDAPLSCDEKSWTQTVTATYTVPPDPPDTINIVALAHDFFPGNFTVDRALFPTTDTEHWNGTLRTNITDEVCTGSGEGEVRLLVEGDDVTGTVDVSETGSCPGGFSVSFAGSASITGTFDREVFRLQLSGFTGTATSLGCFTLGDLTPTVGPPGTAAAMSTHTDAAGGVMSCNITLEREGSAPGG